MTRRPANATTVYDPTCGSGSLLLKVGDEASAKVTLYGQEKDAATSGLARMNMILHNNPTALIEQGNTFTYPKFKDGDTLKTFDYVVANPPFSDKRWSTGLDPLTAFLDSASEDRFTEKLLVPLFRRLGFSRISTAGHKDKRLEFGKDLWMKYQLPTGHWLYFCAQIKKDKIDAAGASDNRNVSAVLNQAKMAFDNPIFDPDTNQKVLLDHMFIISAGDITKAARTWLAEHLDAGQQRQIIFMDRDEFLNHSARILVDL